MNNQLITATHIYLCANIPLPIQVSNQQVTDLLVWVCSCKVLGTNTPSPPPRRRPSPGFKLVHPGLGSAAYILDKQAFRDNPSAFVFADADLLNRKVETCCGRNAHPMEH